MSLTPNNFEIASYAEPQPGAAAVVTTAPAASMGAPASVAAAAQTAAPDPAALPYAIALGLGGAALGALVYAGFIHATHIRIGYLSIVVAFVIAKAMMIGSRNRGGFQYQVVAIALTTLAVSAGNAILLYWAVVKDRPIDLTAHNIVSLLLFGVEEPFLEFAASPARAAIRLLILFYGFRAAWRMTSGDPRSMRHPFTR
ncbi:MAG TPA: hypothetical protein VLI45_00805 [Acidobacteriaceae bacterium]|nr:hypothetical protein [Acidobacteriaceae bacterium]